MRALLVITTLVAFALQPGVAHADASDRMAIIRAVDAFMQAIKEQDPELMTSVTTDSGMVSGLIYQDGTAEFRTWPFKEDRERLAKGSAGTWVESYWDPTVLIHNGIAVLWAPYSMQVDDIRLHCGIDVFNLAKIEEEWKIVSILFTAEPDGCQSQD